MFRKRWVRRVLAGLVVSLFLIVIGVFVNRYLDRRAGEKRYAAAVAHLDATDPRWRFDDLDAGLGPVPDDRNGAKLIPPFKATLDARLFDTAGKVDKEPVIPPDYASKAPPNRALADEAYEAVDDALAANRDALAIALQFADRPHGLRRYTLAPNPIETLLPEVQDTRLVARLLDLAGERAGRDGRGGLALGYVRPIVNAGRSLESEPFMISALVRMACLKMAVTRVERTLGLAEPRGRLAEVQALFLQEADADLFWFSFRGDRAVMDALFSQIGDGSLPLGAMAGSGPGSNDFQARFVTWRYAPHLAADHATYLEIMGRAYEARSLPEHQQRAALIRVEREIKNLPRAEFGSLLTRLLTPAFTKIHDGGLRTKAQLRCAAAGIAVERFRLATGRWLTNLDEIPKDLLPAVPLDPFDGKLLKFARFDDGVTVYSVGIDETDDGGTIRPGKATNEPGQDVGFRLYDPAHRGLPAGPRPNPNGFWADLDELEKLPDGTPVEKGPEPRESEER